ncbi:hypothetical protein SPONL_299 [uncultured Candidatus Thioglobus sp.]|nr:hypothetical protein SPONL_299 [uncultured Candidatus Thioglobus sp.]
MKNYQHITELANQKDAESQYQLGLIYELGLGIDKDLLQAFEWYQKSANQNHPKAQYNLGVFYALSKGGIDKDIQQSKYWIRCAHENGYSGGSIF